MSTTATKVAARPAPRKRPGGPASGGSERSGAKRRSAAPPARRQPTASTRGARKPSSLAFVVLTATVAAVMVLGLVALQALLAQASFKIDDLQSRVQSATQASQELTSEAARLASPGRIAGEAQKLGMTLPSNGIQVLRVPNDAPARHRGKAVGVRP